VGRGPAAVWLIDFAPGLLYHAKLMKRDALGWLGPALAAGILLGAGLVFSQTWNPPLALRIALGFLSLFLLPGWLLHQLLIPNSRFLWLERIPLALPESLGVFAFPALLAFYLELSLAWVLSIFAVILFILLLAVTLRALERKKETTAELARPPLAPTALVSVLLLVLGLSVLAYFLQAFRGLALDWDYFNYISQVRKLVDNFAASNAHFAYRDAPADPIHSYNLWALLWALIAGFGRVDPIVLYLNAAFLTEPLAALAFFTLARRILEPSAALAAFFLFLAYHVIYGGLTFLGATTFFPEDSMWLLAYPGLLALLLDYLENSGKGAAITLALAVLGVSIVHVLWGLGFYLSAGCLILGYALSRGDLASSLRSFFKSGPVRQLLLLATLFGLPVVLAVVFSVRLVSEEDPNWFLPLISFLPMDPLWLYLVLFLGLPLLLFLVWVKPFESGRGTWPARTAGEPPLIRRGLALILLAVLVSLPYILLRYQAIQMTQWQTFGRNPYRAFLTGTLFFLNPFRFTWSDPNLTSYPLYLLGLFALPLLWRKTRSWPLLLVLTAIPAVIAITWDAPLSTLFARFFSLGYLRRLLRIIGILAFLPAGFLIARTWERLASLDKRAWLFLPGAFSLAALLCLAAIPWPAKPIYYNHLFSKMVTLLRSAPRDSLLYDDTPFRFLQERRLVQPGEVVFSDVFTSFRLTAYLNAYVAVQQKPGVGVPDQDQRRLDEIEFFLPTTSLERIRQLLDRYHAGLVIINRNPSYQIYNYSCGHPETIGKLKQDPEHFTLLLDQDDWAIFRYYSL